MFNCRTELSCDFCGKTYSSEGSRMSDCTSKLWFRKILCEKGWKTMFGAYDVCPDCVAHYGLKHIRKMLIEEAKRSNNNESISKM